MLMRMSPDIVEHPLKLNSSLLVLCQLMLCELFALCELLEISEHVLVVLPELADLLLSLPLHDVHLAHGRSHFLNLNLELLLIAGSLHLAELQSLLKLEARLSDGFEFLGEQADNLLMLVQFVLSLLESELESLLRGLLLQLHLPRELRDELLALVDDEFLRDVSLLQLLVSLKKLLYLSVQLT